jgi:c-di-GMP-binding flagellar brake protein YcgR
VPASRSRTERWFECLRQVAQRDGAIEITIPASGLGGSDLIWRVRIVSLTDDEILVEQPNAAGQYVEFAPGVSIVGVMAIGQNRWMFRTNILPPDAGRSARPIRVLRLAMPDHVERCQRRNFYRISTAALSLPRVECWPLINPSSVVAAEVANKALICDMINSGGSPHRFEDESLLLPEVGPRFIARLVNLGGGGAGLMIDRSESSAADRARLFWIRVNLMPTIPAPIAMTARLVHTHIDSSQNIYAGMAFEWSFNAGHRDFVVAQITRYVGQLQRQQQSAAKKAA